MKSPLPRHGTRNRYREPYNCRCIACVSRHGSVADDYVPVWPISKLEEAVSLEVLRMWFDEEIITDWRTSGVSDADADRVAVKLGMMPEDIWSGYTTAGLDFPS